jgi:predicted ester cyclase
MSQENVALAHRWFDEVWNQRREETIDELLLPSSVGHMETGDVQGGEGFKTVRAQFLSALPDLRFVIDDTAAEGENVVVRWSVYGTHAGKGLDTAPTRSHVEIHGITWLKIRDGYIVEGWDRWNLGGFIAHLQSLQTAAPEPG